MKYTLLKNRLLTTETLADLNFKIRNAFTDKMIDPVPAEMDSFEYLHKLLTGSKLPDKFKSWLGDYFYEKCTIYAAHIIELYPDVKNVPEKDLMKWIRLIFILYGIILYKILFDRRITTASLTDEFSLIDTPYKKLLKLGETGVRAYSLYVHAKNEVNSINSILIVKKDGEKIYKKLSYHNFLIKRMLVFEYLKYMIIYLMELAKHEISSQPYL
ncbi:MAG: hypothetical protein ACP5O2_03920 [Bacteroidales bacterium]